MALAAHSWTWWCWIHRLVVDRVIAGPSRHRVAVHVGGKFGGVALRLGKPLEECLLSFHLLGLVTHESVELPRVRGLQALEAPIDDLAIQVAEVGAPFLTEGRDFRGMRAVASRRDMQVIRQQGHADVDPDSRRAAARARRRR